MAAALLVLTVGGVMVYSALTGTSIIDVFAGKKEDTLDSQGGSKLSDVASSFTAGAAAGAVGPAPAATNQTGTGIIDGKRVAKWIIPQVKWARAHGWKGKVTSGYRTPLYSQSLCFGICDAPSCNGTCAGLSSNHSGSKSPEGAIDVSDPAEFTAALSDCPYRPKLHNDLPNDLGHMSATGH